MDQESSSEEEEDDDDAVFVIESTDKHSKKNKKISNKSKITDSKSMNNKKSHDAKFNFRKRVHVISQSSQSSRSNLSSRSSIWSTSSSDGSGSSCRRKSSSSSLSSDDDTVTRKDGKPLKKRLLGVATPKRQRLLSSSDEDSQAKSSVSKEKQFESHSPSKSSKSKEKASKKRGRPSLKDLKKSSKRSKSKEKVSKKRRRPSGKDLKKRQKLSKTTASKEKVSNSGDRIKSKNLKRKAISPKQKSKYQSQLDSKDRHSSTDSSILIESSSDEDTSSQFYQNAKVQPLKAFKSSLEQKISKQDTRITAMENNMNEEDEIFNGKNLNDIFASTGQKLAIKLAIAMKGDSLKDYVLTENGEESANSDRIPWTIAEIAVLRKVMMRKCKLNSEQFAKKYSSYKTAINSRSRYDYREHLKRLGIKPNSKRARILSKSKKNRFYLSSDEEEDSRSTFKKKKVVSFSSPLSQSILDDTLGAPAEASTSTVVSIPSNTAATQQSNLSSTSSLTASDIVNSNNIQQSQLMATSSPTIPDSSASSLPSNQSSVLNSTNAQKLLQLPLNKNAHQNHNNEE